jgi:hypothetical protein
MGLSGVTGRQRLLCTHDPGKGCVSSSTIPLPAMAFLWADHVILQVVTDLFLPIQANILFNVGLLLLPKFLYPTPILRQYHYGDRIYLQVYQLVKIHGDSYKLFYKNYTPCLSFLISSQVLSILDVVWVLSGCTKSELFLYSLYMQLLLDFYCLPVLAFEGGVSIIPKTVTVTHWVPPENRIYMPTYI